jgi:hypothetical protein
MPETIAGFPIKGRITQRPKQGDIIMFDETQNCWVYGTVDSRASAVTNQLLAAHVATFHRVGLPLSEEEAP